MATTKMPSHPGHKVLPTCGPETDFGTQIQQKKYHGHPGGQTFSDLRT